MIFTDMPKIQINFTININLLFYFLVFSMLLKDSKKKTKKKSELVMLRE